MVLSQEEKLDLLLQKMDLMEKGMENITAIQKQVDNHSQNITELVKSHQSW